MTTNDLPLRWRERVERFVQDRSGGKRRRLGATDFPAGKIVHLEFPDGSSAHFRFAFVIEAREINEVGIFTEHCGYHVFPAADTVVHIQEESA